MTNKQPDALRLAGLLELAPEDGVEPQTTEDAAAELRRLHTENTALQQGYAAARLEIESLQARIKTMAEEHADELMVAHLDGRMRAAQPAGAQQPGAAYAALPDADRDYMRKVVAVAVTMLFDGYKEDVTRVFSTGELSEFVTITAAMGGERVEDIYRRAWDLLSLPARASHGQAPAGLAVPSMSADEVNALPTAARAYIHQLATNTDPAGMVRENMQLRDTNAGLQSMYRKAADAAQEVVGCFHAAECEGLQAALAGTADEHLKDLVERRLMHALYAAQEVAGQAPAQAAPDVSGYVSEWASGICTADEAMAGIAKLYGAQAAPTTQPAPQQEPSHTAVQLAELVLSDCGHSSNYTPLLDRVAARIDSHTERRLDELRGCLESKPAPQQEAQDAAFEAVRKNLCALQRYSFCLDDDGVVRRVQDRTGNWIEFDDAHKLFDPVAVDAARKKGENHD